MKEFSIPKEACDVLTKMYDHESAFFNRAFYREMNYQCRELSYAADVTPAIVKSMCGKPITQHTDQELLSRGYWLDGEYPSLRSENYLYKEPSSICIDGKDRYLQALLEQSECEEVKSSDKVLGVNGLITLYLVQLYMIRIQVPTIIPECTVNKYDGNILDSKLLIRDNSEANAYGLIDELLMYDVLNYVSVVDMEANTCLTTVRTTDGVVSIEDDYYAGKSIEDMIEQHLAIASNFDQKSVYIHPELLITQVVE